MSDPYTKILEAQRDAHEAAKPARMSITEAWEHAPQWLELHGEIYLRQIAMAADAPNGIARCESAARGAERQGKTVKRWRFGPVIATYVARPLPAAERLDAEPETWEYTAEGR